MLAIIAGGELEQLPGFKRERRLMERTPYGLPEAPIALGRIGGVETLFLRRHGTKAPRIPSKVNFKANAVALKELGAGAVLSLTVAYALLDGTPPLSLLCPDDLIDYGPGEGRTFALTEQTPFHCPTRSVLYSPDAREAVARVAKAARLPCPFAGEGVLGSLDGSRHPTGAEAARMVGHGVAAYAMSTAQEPSLFMELGIPFAHLAIVIGPDPADLPERSSETIKSQSLAACEAFFARMDKWVDAIA